MMALLTALGRYALARLEERTTVMGIVGFVMSAAGFGLDTGTVGVIVNTVVSVASLVAMVVPGGK